MMNNFEQDHDYIPPATAQFPLFNEHSFPGAENCIASKHGLPIPVEWAEFPLFSSLEVSTTALAIVDEALTGVGKGGVATMYICNALEMATYRVTGRFTHPVLTELKRYIALALAGRATYVTWLTDNLGGEMYAEDNNWCYWIHDARAQWLKWMATQICSNIKQLEEAETAACTKQETYLATPYRWLTTK